MALNYIVNFGDRTGTLYRIEIDNPNYTGDPIELIPSENPLILSWEGNSDDDIFKTHVIPSSISIGVVSTGLDFDTLFYINDTSFKTRVYRAGELYWSGYLISDGVQEIDSGVPFDVTLTAVDGLAFLDNTPLVWNNYTNGRINIGGVLNAQRAPINAFRVALYESANLNNPLPIRWNSSLKNDSKSSSDMIAGLTVINPRGELSQTEKTNYWWLENLCKSAQSWLYQRNGRWYINRYFDTYGYEITTNTTSEQTPSNVLVNDLTELQASDTLNESWYWFGKKPLGSVEVLYQSTRDANNNIVPNGDFSITSLGSILYWEFTENPSGGAFYDIYETSITESGGNSVDLIYPTDSSTPTNRAVFSFNNYTSVDADKLFRDFLLSFTVMPLNGFVRNTSTNIINWDNKPLKIKVEFLTGGKSFYLNEFGFWQRVPLTGNFLEMSASNLNSKSIKFTFTGVPMAGNVINFQFKYNNLGIDTYPTGQYIVTENDENLGISHMVSNIGNIVISQLPHSSSWSYTYNSNSITFSNVFSGTTTNNGSFVNNNSSGIDRDGFMSISAQGTAIGDVINFQFQGKGTNNSNILFPRGKGRVKVSFMLKEGQRYVLDNVRMTVGTANDVYTVSLPSSPNSKESYQIGISSGYSGFMYSSYGSSYSDVHLNEYWNGGKTLTQLYGEAIMSVRNRPCRVFSGTIDRLMEWGLFSLMGHVYAPLSMRVNIKDKTTEVVGVEFAPSTPMGGYAVTHKSSGDN